jgi:hypothetical protein
VNLAPWPTSGGTWSWAGPNSFTANTRAIYGIALPFGTNTYTATYTTPSGFTSTQAFVITVNSTPITPYLEVDGGAWQNVATVTVNYTDTVNLAPWPTSGGTWSWAGPNNFTANTRAIYGVALPFGTNTYTATYTNQSGVTSTQAFVITVSATPITPYIEVNGGAWQQTNSLTVGAGSTVNLAPWPTSGGTWSWSGSNSYTASTRAIYGIPLTSGSNTYTATYTNPSGVQSVETFTITVE